MFNKQTEQSNNSAVIDSKTNNLVSTNQSTSTLSTNFGNQNVSFGQTESKPNSLSSAPLKDLKEGETVILKAPTEMIKSEMNLEYLFEMTKKKSLEDVVNGWKVKFDDQESRFKNISREAREIELKLFHTVQDVGF